MDLERGTAATIARMLGGRKSGSGFVLRCVAHDDRNPSLSVADGDHGLLVRCFAGCEPRDILAELRRRGLLDDRRRELFPGLPPTGHAAAQHLAALPPTDRISAILKLSRPFLGTSAEKYLIGRGLDPELANPEALRFLPAMGTYPPTMVAVVTAFADASRILGLQFTPLKPDGSRGQRTFLRGSKIGGGVVRLVDDAEVTYDLGLGEGTETALAVMTAMKRDGRMVLPVWSALNAGNLGRLPVLPGIERLYVFADNDVSGTGQRAAETLAQRWAAAGREARIALPPAGDWNMT